jgi:hypothetical protein
VLQIFNIEQRRKHVLDQQLREKLHACERVAPIHLAMTFAPEGLVLGAGTILVPAEGMRRLKNLEGQEQRILALLSAAHGKAVSPSVLGNIERAGKAWSVGDDCLAYIHLAHAGLPLPVDLRSAAWRLIIADAAMNAGVSARAIFQALEAGGSSIGTIEKYDPGQPRVPAGQGRISGQWTRLLSWVAELNAAQAAALGLYAARLAIPIGGATAVFGLLFIPSPNIVRVEDEVEGIPGLRYSWNRDETVLHLTYDGVDGARRTFALRWDGKFIHDENGQVVGRIIGGNRVVIDTLAILPDLVKQDEPRLCPAPEPDRAGSDQGRPYEENRARQYEDFVKRLINPPPDGPTPSGYVYYLVNPKGGEPGNYDDCKKKTGMLFEIKGERYAELLKSPPILVSIGRQFLDQSGKQIAASGGRPIVWIFAEKEAALFARALFDTARDGREHITVGYVPWTGRNP